jgi:anti-anti-sigma regulatory factor
MNAVPTNEHFETDRIGDVMVVRFLTSHLFLSQENAEEIGLSLAKLIGRDTAKMLFDLRNVQMVGSMFLLVVLLVLKSVWQVKGRFAMCNLQQPVLTAFRVALIDPEPPRIFNTREEALDYLAG